MIGSSGRVDLEAADPRDELSMTIELHTYKYASVIRTYVHSYVQRIHYPLLVLLVVVLPKVAVPSLARHVKYSKCKAAKCESQQ